MALNFEYYNNKAKDKDNEVSKTRKSSGLNVEKYNTRARLKDEQLGKTRAKPEETFEDRDDSKLGAFFKGTAKQYGGGHASAGATMLQNETAREGFNAMGDHTQQPAKFLSDLIVNKIKGDNFTQKVEEKQNKELNAYGKDAVKRADEMIQSGAKDLEYVKEDMNGLGKFGVDAGSQLLMMGADAMLSFIPGVGPALSQASLASRAGGLGASEARAEGAGEAQQLVYGAASGLLELGLEKIFSAGKLMKNMYGKGALNLADATASKVATSNLLKGITKTAKGQELVYNLTKLGVASTEEGIEEALSAVLTPFLQRAIYSDELEMASIEDILYDFAVGAVSGGVFGGLGTAADYRAGVGTAEQIKQNPGFIDMVLNKGMAQNEGTEANAFAQNLQSQQAAGKNILGSQLNELNRMNKLEQLKNDDALARTVAKETSDISRIKENVSETEKRAIQRISDKKAEDISIDLSKKVAQNANLSLGFSAENVEIPAISRVMLGTATSADIDVILANPQAKSLLGDEIGETIPMENSKAREMIGTMVAMNARANGEQILKESKVIIAEDLANTGGTLGAKGKQMFVSTYPQVAEADNEKFTTIFKRFYDGGTYNIPYEKITELVSGMGEDYAAVANKYFTPEMRMSLYEAGMSDSKAQLEANERSVVKREKVADRQRKGAFEDQSTAGNLSKPMRTALEKLADRAGVNIVYVDTLGNANGEYKTGRNGAYLNSTIVLAADSTNPLLAVAKHELTHHIKTTAPKQYKELEDYVFGEWYKNDPKAYEEAIEKKIEQYKEAGITLTRDGAKEEILADASERFFTDESAIDRVIAYSKALGEAILDGIRTVLDSFTAIMDEEGIRLKGYGDFMEQLGIVEEAERLWMKALEASMTADVKADERETKYSLLEGKKSLKDTEDRTLTAGQQEYFKNSKVRDAEGRLKVVFHGTPAGNFTVFKDGSYFTDNPEYADRYQSPSASSISYGKEATAPKTFEVYLNIKKPFDIRNPEARRVYIEDYIKGGNAMGINPYLSDAEYDKIQSIDWTEGEDLRDFLIDEGYDYDGLVLDEGADGGYGDEVQYRGESYVVFSPEQVKNVDNENPTDSPDIRFSLKEPVEETRDLIAVHNMQANELEKTLDLGGFPMPSIAVIKAQAGHGEYGDVSVVFSKDTIDPELMKANKVYGGDAWTPTYPRIEYKANAKAEKRISNFYYGFASRFGYEEARPLYNYVHDLEEQLNRNNGAKGVLENLQNDTGLMQMYLMDSGKGKVENIETETVTEMSEADIEMNDYLINALGKDVLGGYKTPPGESPMTHRKKWLAENKSKIEAAYSGLMKDVYGFDEAGIENVIISMRPIDYMKIVREALYYLENGPKTVKTEVDTEATKNKIREAAGEGYAEWLNDLFANVEEKSGIRNNADPFTNSGNRRSWEALHWEENLENVVRVMKEGLNGEMVFGANILAVGTKDYSSIDEIKADSSRLARMDQEEYEAIKETYNSRFFEIANSIADKNAHNQFIAIDEAANAIIDAVRKYKTKSGIAKYLKSYNNLTVEQYNIDDIISLVQDIGQMPTEYFEAKPRRAVGLDEIKAIIVPTDIDTELLNRLTIEGYNVVQYEAGNSEDRVEKLNSLENLRFQLKDSEPTEAKKVQSLEDKVARLKSEFKRTDLKTPNEDQVKSQASKLIKRYGSSVPGSHTQVVQAMKDIFRVYKTEGANWDDAMRIANDAAMRIVDKIEILHDESWQEYKDLRNYLKNTGIKLSENDKKGIADYEAFRKGNFGRLKLTDSGRPIYEVYQNLIEEYPGMFTDDYTNGVDQIRHIVDVLDSMKPWYETYDSAEMGELVSEVAADIMETAYGLQTRKTFADRKAEEKEKAVARVKKQRDKAVERLQERVDEKLVRIADLEKTLKWKEAEQKLVTDIAVARQKEKDRQSFERREKAARERISRRKLFKRIEDNTKWFAERLLKPTDVKHLPAGYAEAIAEVLSAFDFETTKSDKWEANYGPSKKTIDLRNLRIAYSKVLENSQKEENDSPYEADQYILDVIDDLIKRIHGMRVEDLDTDTLGEVDMLLRHLKHQINLVNKVFNEEIKQSISALGESVIEELEDKKDSKEYSREFINSALDFLNESNAKPTEIFEGVGGTMNKLYQAIRKGFDKKIENDAASRKFLESVVSDKKAADKWTREIHKVTLEGKEVELTTSQIMSLYALMKREQARRHIEGSGITIAPLKITKGIKAEKNGEKVSKALKKTKVKPSYQELTNLFKLLSEDQIEVVDKIQKYMSTDLSALGNEVSLQLYGYEKFTEKNYFPIKSSAEWLSTDFSGKEDIVSTIQSASMTKKTDEHANNPIVIDDFFTTVTNHVSTMNLYNAMVLPLSDFRRVYNYKRTDEEGSQGLTVKSELGRAYGDRMNRYIKRFMKDVNTSYADNRDLALVQNLISKYKKATIAFKTRVLLQQPTALFRSMLIIKPKYLRLKPSKKDYEEMHKYSPISLWKSWGYYNTDIGPQTKDVLLGNEDNLFERIGMGFYSKADDYAWACIWKSVKAEMKANNPDMDANSEEFLRKVGEKASYIYDRTQVVDSVFHRSQLMRNKDVASKSLTSFMSEPTTTYNMLRFELLKAKAALESGKKKEALAIAMRVMSVHVATAALTAGAAAIADATYGAGDDEEEEKWLERWVDNTYSNFTDNASIVGLLPLTSDIKSMFEGYEPTDMSMQGIYKAVQAINTWKKIASGESDYSVMYGTRRTAEAIGYLTGTPVGNVLKELEGISRTGMEAIGKEKYSDFIYAKTYYNPVNKKNAFIDLYYDAKSEGNGKLANDIRKYILSKGVKREDIEDREYYWKKNVVTDYADDIEEGKKTIEDVPGKWRSETNKELAKRKKKAAEEAKNKKK